MSQSEPGDPDQLTLVVAPGKRRVSSREPEPVAAELPIAQIYVDVSLPHLDRPFDYLVPESMAHDAVAGARVSVRFAGADHDGFIAQRVATSDHGGRLSRLRRVVSPEPVLTADVARLARAVADRYAGTVSDVLRLAVPPRHAASERVSSPPPPAPPTRPAPGGWAAYRDGTALLDTLADGGTPRAVWNPGPGADWPDLIARLVVATLASSRGGLVVVPDGRDLDRVEAALVSIVGDGFHVALEAEPGPAERYARWLAVCRGSRRAVVGTRSAAFAPIHDLGLVCVWDDGDDLHAEPRAPYPHTRDVLLLRAHQTGAAAVVGGFARTAEAEQLVNMGWARSVMPERLQVRAAAPRVRVSGDDYEQARDEAARRARLPSLAWRVAREGLMTGPVLVQVPRTGYLPALACAWCRAPARCTACAGPLTVEGAGDRPQCGWCATTYPVWRCPQCGHHLVRAMVTGVRRTAEELGRAFPGVPVLMSKGDAVRSEIDSAPALVVATPGAEPFVADGYSAALLLDATAMLGRPGLRAAEEALRRWLRAAVLVRTGARGGQVVIVAAAEASAVQALVRWDPAGFAARELTERTALRLPPAVRLAELTGTASDISDLLAYAQLPDGAEVLGAAQAEVSVAAEASSGQAEVSVAAEASSGQAEVSVAAEASEDQARIVIRVPRSSGTALGTALRAAAGVRSARRNGGPVRVRVDPVDLG